MIQLVHHVKFCHKSIDIKTTPLLKITQYRIILRDETDEDDQQKVGKFVINEPYLETDFAIRYDQNTDSFIEDNIIKLY